MYHTHLTHHTHTCTWHTTLTHALDTPHSHMHLTHHTHTCTWHTTLTHALDTPHSHMHLTHHTHTCTCTLSTLYRPSPQQVQQPQYGGMHMGAGGYNHPPQLTYGMQSYSPQFQAKGGTRPQGGGGRGTSGIIGAGGFQPKREKLDPDYGDVAGEWDTRVWSGLGRGRDEVNVWVLVHVQWRRTVEWVLTMSRCAMET